MFRLRIVVPVMLTLAIATSAAAGVTTGGVIRPSNYNSMIPPAAGTAYVDASFGTSVKRISAAREMTDNLDGGPLTWVLPEYSTPALFNSDNSRLLLMHNSYFGVYDGNGTFLKDAAYDMNASTEPRWSRTNNNIVYYRRGNQLKSYNVATDAVTVVKTFSEYSAVNSRGESDMCWDGDHVVLVGDQRYVFVYTLSTGVKGPVFDTAGNSFDSVYMSADDKVTITWDERGVGRFHGIELFDKNMTFLRQLTQAGGHMDMSRDVNGDPVLVWTNANDPAAICQNGIVKIRLSDGAQTCVAGLQLDWNLAVHISGSDQGWAVVSTYAPSDPDPNGNWPPYTNEIFRMKLDGSMVERLSHHRSRPWNDYNWQAWASINRDGTRIVYGSNFGLQSILGYPTEYSDTYLITVDGGSPTPTPTPTPTPVGGGRVEQTDAAVSLGGSWFTNSNAGHSAGSAALSMEAGTSASITFNGTGVTWRGARDQWSGLADVYLDDVYKGRVDTYTPGEILQAPLWSVAGLSAGTHTLRVEVVGAGGPSASGAWVWVDAFDVVSGAPP